MDNVLQWVAIVALFVMAICERHLSHQQTRRISRLTDIADRWSGRS